ncbi:hypothetical protein GCM10009550_46350 [Actinocorallia libanotica]|uniref:Fibronectin type III-like domain-containing protein n=1 Tax=Actinocorallia libanotica TaxID=46162 RepID=A0ABN1RJ26_9ACTN
MVSGRPLLLERVARTSNALLLAPLLGEAAGDAVAAALFGTADPGGRLPASFPRHLGQVPIYHGHRHGSGYDHPTGDTYAYVDLDDQSPLFAFGHGLSYTAFELRHAGEAEARDGMLRAPVRVSNTGRRDGETVVQLYARDEYAGVVRPVRQLLQFQRVALAAGESADLVLEAPVERLCHTLPDGRRGLEAGDVTLLAGFSSADIRCTATVPVDAINV